MMVHLDPLWIGFKGHHHKFVYDIAIFVLKREVKLQLTNHRRSNFKVTGWKYSFIICTYTLWGDGYIL